MPRLTPSRQSQPAAHMQRRRRLPVWKRVLFILLADLLVLGLVALAGEAALRLFVPQVNYETMPEEEMTLHRFSDEMYLGFELRPGFGDHNSQGFRGGEVDVARPPGVWRIAVIGDSIPYGLGVDAAEAFPALLESKLNAAEIGRVEVLNFGTPAYSTFHEYTLLRKRVLKFDPQLVIMVFSPGDVETSPVILNIDGSMCLFRNHFEGIDLFNNRLHWAVFRRSHLYRFLYKCAALAMVGPEANFADTYVNPDVSWQNVRRAADLCRQRNIAFMVVLSPLLHPHFRPPREKDHQLLDGAEMLLEADQWRRYNRAFDRIRKLAEQSRTERGGLEIVDLGPLYEKHQGEMKLLAIDHEHLGRRGHQLVAGVLLEKLLKNPIRVVYKSRDSCWNRSSRRIQIAISSSDSNRYQFVGFKSLSVINDVPGRFSPAQARSPAILATPPYSAFFHQEQPLYSLWCRANVGPNSIVTVPVFISSLGFCQADAQDFRRHPLPRAPHSLDVANCRRLQSA